MPDYPIKLGRKMSDSMPEPVSSSDTHYPSLYLEWDDSYDLPESGMMTVRFVKTGENNSTHRGEKRQTVNLDVTEIVSVKAGKKRNSEDDEDTGSRLDRIKKEVESDYE